MKKAIEKAYGKVSDMRSIPWGEAKAMMLASKNLGTQQMGIKHFDFSGEVFDIIDASMISEIENKNDTERFSCLSFTVPGFGGGMEGGAVHSVIVVDADGDGFEFLA